jgi:hypothetical protein
MKSMFKLRGAQTFATNQGPFIDLMRANTDRMGTEGRIKNDFYKNREESRLNSTMEPMKLRFMGSQIEDLDSRKDIERQKLELDKDRLDYEKTHGFADSNDPITRTAIEEAYKSLSPFESSGVLPTGGVNSAIQSKRRNPSGAAPEEAYIRGISGLLADPKTKAQAPEILEFMKGKYGDAWKAGDAPEASDWAELAKDPQRFARVYSKFLGGMRGEEAGGGTEVFNRLMQQGGGAPSQESFEEYLMNLSRQRQQRTEWERARNVMPTANQQLEAQLSFFPGLFSGKKSPPVPEAPPADADAIEEAIRKYMQLSTR